MVDLVLSITVHCLKFHDILLDQLKLKGVVLLTKKILRQQLKELQCKLLLDRFLICLRKLDLAGPQDLKLRVNPLKFFALNNRLRTILIAYKLHSINLRPLVYKE